MTKRCQNKRTAPSEGKTPINHLRALTKGDCCRVFELLNSQKPGLISFLLLLKAPDLKTQNKMSWCSWTTSTGLVRATSPIGHATSCHVLVMRLYESYFLLQNYNWWFDEHLVLHLTFSSKKVLLKAFGAQIQDDPTLPSISMWSKSFPKWKYLTGVLASSALSVYRQDIALWER